MRRGSHAGPRAPAVTVSARIGAFIVGVARAKGADSARLAALTGFDADRLADPDVRIPLAQEEALWNAAAELTADEHFGLHAAQAIRPGAFDVLDYAVRTAATLRDALENLVRYNRLVHDTAVFTLTDRRTDSVLEHRFVAPGLVPCRHAAEFTLAAVVQIGNQIVAQPLRPTAVSFMHPTPRSLLVHEQVFGVRPRFDAPASSLVFARSALACEVIGADPGLARIVTAHADALLRSSALAPTWTDKVRHRLAEDFARGTASLGVIARHLAVSERSLQRRLADEGVRFADLVDAVRRELAMRYIADPELALGEVAYLLGFAEPSPFHRAFRRWTGSTPAATRRAAGINAPGS